MKQIICMNWGTAYGADYVNRLYSMVSRRTKSTRKEYTDPSAQAFCFVSSDAFVNVFAKYPDFSLPFIR